MEIFITSVDRRRILNNNIDLRFGKDDFSGKYINIYVENEFIATCFYRENAYVSGNWYERFFINNYFFGRDGN